MSETVKSSPEISRGQKIARQIIGILVGILFTFAMLEALLYFLDPLGTVTYIHSFAMLWETSIPSETGYTFREGEHKMLDYNYTILEDESRFVPASNPDASCTIAAIGDSLTFGMGVEDDETWVNYIAEVYPDVHFLNYGRPVFSAGNVLRSHDAYPADAYIWLVVDNDDFPDREYIPNDSRYPSATRLYWLYTIYPALFGELPFEALYGGGDTSIPGRSPSAEAAAVMAEDTLIFGFDKVPARNIEQAIIIPEFTEQNSPMDAHPSEIGNQQIADEMLPYLDNFIAAHCG